MTSSVYREIEPLRIKRGMQVRVVDTYQSGTTQVTEGPVNSIGNGTTILIGDPDYYVEVPVKNVSAKTVWYEVITLPETRESVVLVRQPDDHLQAMICRGDGSWVGSGATWSHDDVLPQLDRVLWVA